ncbi:CDF family Co(II)/Ni(II) efflux transporter DmeF [Paraburkholderia sp. MPAMCS5]|uniref:CDF family Co(II)/Ni(II) efflux transporter DmeF n=1 Tax=Paraburkholderia sp. MPAMCS5 TaxID=3112563 RepID=UPI002E186C04|nr:CDF family Co(II)/Ni(II) efflux transporter DmeF [Paraburkholderia sp. MPAMCS5]
MNDWKDASFDAGHDHIFLGAAHEQNERRTWAMIVLCAVMMVAEIAGGSLFGSLALVADGLHMSTHAGAMLIAALAYTYARKHASDPRFVFGTGKLGDLAGFTSAIVLALIALLIGYEAVQRLFAPVPIHFGEAIPVAVFGLLVNIASAWLLSGDHHGHGHGHGHGHAHGHGHDNHEHDPEEKPVTTKSGNLILSIFEDGVPPVFRIGGQDGIGKPGAQAVKLTTLRADGARQTFGFTDRGAFLQSTTEIPEPHAFTAILEIGGERHGIEFEEHDHRAMHADVSRDHNIRAAYVHVIADAAVSVLTIIGLLLAWRFGWVWMDPLAGIVGALVIANWSYGLMRDTGAILLDMNHDRRLTEDVRKTVENAGDKLVDLHVWRLGPGHMGAVLSVNTDHAHHGPAFFHAALARFKGLSHITVEVNQSVAA